MLARIHRPCAVQKTSKMYKKWKGRPGAQNGFSGGAVSEPFFRSEGLPNCHKAKKATFGAVPVISSKQRFRMEGALLFAPPSLQGLPRGPPKIPVGSPRSADWCSHADETLVFLKSERFACELGSTALAAAQGEGTLQIPKRPGEIHLLAPRRLPEI